MPPSNPHHYMADGQLTWDAIRGEYMMNASPEELKHMGESPREIFERKGWARPGEAKKSPVEKLAVKKSTEVHHSTRIAIILEYQNGTELREIAESRRLNPKTVRNVLQGAGAYDESRPS